MAHLPISDYSDTEWIKDAILEASTYGILAVSNDLKILHYNEEFIKLLNLPIKISYRTNLNDLLEFVKTQTKNPDVFTRLYCKYRKYHGKFCFYLELCSGKVIEVCSSPILRDKQFKGRIFNFRDVSESQKVALLEEKIRTNQKLLEENLEYEEIKNRFLNTISHEFKTPLTVILGAVQLIMTIHNKETMCPTFKKARENLDMIRKNCYRMIKLTNNLLDITKIDSGILDLDLKNQDIVSIIEDVTLSTVKYAKMKGITVTFESNIEEKIIGCDAYLLERVMLNLISNAIKYTNTNGEIKVYIEDCNDSIIIRVKDNGIGIPEEKQDVIFDRFGLADTSFKRDHEGIGIGLAIVKSLVEQHGGKISLQSQVNYGSEFIIELPGKTVNEVGNRILSTRNTTQENINIEFSDIYEISI